MSHKGKKKDLNKSAKSFGDHLEQRMNDANKPPIEEKKRIRKLKKAFFKFDQENLISALAGLQIDPELQSNGLRLEVATRAACAIEEHGIEKVDPLELQTLLNDYLPPNCFFGMYEDPSEDLFTTNIQFIGGNYLVFPGVTSGETFILQNLINALGSSGDELLDEFVSTIYPVIISALAVSNEAARRMGYKRYQIGQSENWQDLILPKKDQFNRLQASVLFSKEEINGLLSHHNLEWESLDPLISHVGDKRLNNDDLTGNPLVLKPFIETDTGAIILANPGSVIFGLRHFILSMARSMGVMNLLLRYYSEKIWARVRKQLGWMGYVSISNLEPSVVNDHPELKEAFYEIDTDKIAYVQLIPDLCDGFDYNQPDTIWDPKIIFQAALLREREITELLEKTYGKEKKVFTLRIFGYIGRGVYLGLDDQPNLDLVLFPECIDVISKVVEELDPLSLWKFTKLYKSTSGRIKFFHTSFLDLYSLYLDHGHSFYVNDDKLSSMVIDVGYSRKLIEIVSKEWDEHGASRGRCSDYESVSRFSIKEECPLFSPTSRYRETAEFLVEGYSQPIWIEALNGFYGGDDRRLVADMAETIAYWIWQISASLNEILKCLGPEPINLRFILDDIDSWRQIIPQTLEGGPSPVRCIVYKGSIIFWIPASIKILAQRPDNQGERCLVEGLLKGFGAFLKTKGYPNLIDDETRVKIIESHAPLGIKKKMLSINTGRDVALDPTKVPPERLVQDYDWNIQREELAQKLLGPDFVSEEICENERINKICNLAVDHYLKEIRSCLKNLSWHSTLRRLMGNNEAILHQRAFWHFVTPPGIECFGTISETLERDIKNDPKRDITSLANRTLIEIVTSEPPNGNEELSTEKMDELIAVSSQLIEWAMLSERVNLKLTEHKLVIPKTGRIRMERGELETIWSPYYKTKTLEGIERSISDFDREDEIYEGTEEQEREKKEWDEAFDDEFGLSMTEIIDFHLALIKMGSEQNVIIPQLDFVSFITDLENLLQWTGNKVELAIALFSLAPRKAFDKPPELYKAIDVYPWRFNRRLSHLRRPIIICSEPQNNPLVLWGIRQVNESIKYLMHLVNSGRFQNEMKSEKMMTLIGRTNNTSSHNFVMSVKEWFEQQPGWTVASEMPIKPGAKLDSNSDLGDIDILAVDLNGLIIYSIECKKINSSRNAREISQEIDKFVGYGAHDKWSEKHLRRDKWLRDNIRKLQKELGLPDEDFELKSLILTSLEIPSSYFPHMPLKMISFTNLKRSGMDILK